MYIVVFLCTVCVISLLSTSCTSDSEGVTNEITPTQQFKTVSDFKIVGEIHNSLMSATLDNYSCSEEIQSSEQFYQELINFEANVLDTLRFAPSIIKENFIDNLYKYRSCLHKEYLSQSINITRGEISDGQLCANIQALSEAKVLGVKESQQLYTLCDVSQKSFDCEINFEDLKNVVNDLIIDYELTQYAQEADSGYVLAYALTIASYSLEWWENNMAEISSELSEEGIEIIDLFGPDGLVQLVAADIVGGVIGGMADATKQFCQNGDHYIDMDEVGYNALSSAVLGSIGAIPGVQVAVLRWAGFFF